MRIVHILAVATVICAAPLLFLGAEVTSKGAGMIDTEGLRSPWFFLTEFMNDHGLHWLVEHGHRQVGWIVGVLTIATVSAALMTGAPRWVCVLSVLALIAVSLQGTLGILRINLHDRAGPSLAQFHGLFAQVVFGLLLTLAASTSRDWVVGPVNEVKLKWLRRWVVATAAAILGQAALGGVIRHRDLLLASRLHLLGAFVVFAFLFVVIKFARETDYGSFKRLARVLMALLTFQVMLGVEAWMAWMKRHYFPETAASESAAMQLTRSAHYLVGALIFATTAVLLVKAFWAPRRVEAPPS